MVATCDCAALVHHDYVKSLRAVRVWPLEKVYANSSMQDILGRLESFEGVNKKSGGHPYCSFDFKSAVNSGVSTTNGYFDGLCLGKNYLTGSIGKQLTSIEQIASTTQSSMIIMKITGDTQTAALTGTTNAVSSMASPAGTTLSWVAEIMCIRGTKSVPAIEVLDPTCPETRARAGILYIRADIAIVDTHQQIEPFPLYWDVTKCSSTMTRSLQMGRIMTKIGCEVHS